MIKPGIFILFVLLFLSGCTSKKVYENQSGHCRLILYADSTYKLKYPTLIRAHREKGAFSLQDSSILLQRVVENTFDSVDYSTSYLTDRPATVKLSFKNLNDSNIIVRFSLNGDTTSFWSDAAGRKELFYKDLISKKITSTDCVVKSITVFFQNKVYTIKDAFIEPTDIDIRLNQFIGEKTAVLYRHFSFLQDTFYVNGVDPKAIGGDRKLSLE